MDYDEYVGARYGSLLRAAVLLGVPEDEAPGFVDLALAGSTRRIRRSEDPHDEVVEALVRLVPGGSATRFGTASDEDRQRALMLAPSVDQGPGTGGTDYLSYLSALPDDAEREPWRLPRVPGAVVAAAVAVVLLLATNADARIPPPPPPAPAPVPPPSVPLTSTQVPSLFGYARQDARALLIARGLRPTLEPEGSCEAPDRVLGSVPAAGSPVTPGEGVLVYASIPGGTACSLGPVGTRGADRRPIAWQFLDFAAGRGAAPRFARTVGVVIDGGEAAILTGAQARDRRSWGSVLDDITAAVARVGVHDGAYVEPSLAVTVVGDSGLVLRISRPVGGRPCVVRLHYAAHDAIDSVLVKTGT